ncbi:methylenetetrahydrofolate reductase [Nocardioides cheoyonin]|uniref:methylenetetrahydrofolate reductase n=1 Tax=Nocardioides cheoyonin TaxID=3156615 RepID=UPI0032B5DC28
MSDFSLEMTARDVPHLEEARNVIPRRTRINVTFLEHETLELRLGAARRVRELGFVPVPHISARRLESRARLEEFLAALAADGAAERVFVVGGDPVVPHGPFASALSLIESGALPEYGVWHVSVAGYPEGHPDIDDAELWRALEAKATELARHDLAGDVITQFGFDVDAVIGWIEQVRERGIGLPIRVGVAGPAGIRRLVRYASRFGIGTSAGIARKYGFSLTNLMGTAGPDRFLHEFAARYRPEVHGEVRLHFYTFGGLRATSEWLTDFTEGVRR